MPTWLDRLLEGLGEQPVLFVVVSPVGAAIGGVGLDKSWGHRSSIAWGVLIALSVAIPAIGAKRNRLLQGRRAAKAAVKHVLRACAAAHEYPSRHIRANVMLMCTDGQRRRVDCETAYNMAGDPDCDLEIDATAGVSGEAFSSRTPAYGDLRIALQPGGPSWGLRDAEKAKVRRDLKSVLSVPIFDPETPDGPLLGTLQVDSDLTFQEMEFDKPERREVAERFADVIALLLKTGN